jgi:serine/threonine-protein kinase RsbW
MNWTLDLSIASTLSGVRKAAAILREAISDVGSIKMRHEMELALVEACTNSVKHGSWGREDELMHITLAVDDRQIRVVVEDNGKPFQVTKTKLAALGTASLESLPTQGMGLPLIQELMDSVTYEPEGGKNRLVLVKRLQEAGSK